MVPFPITKYQLMKAQCVMHRAFFMPGQGPGPFFIPFCGPGGGPIPPPGTQDERLHVAGWDRKQAAAASGAARSAAKAAELTASQKTAIIDKKVQPGEKPDVHTVGHINREIYKCVTEDIQTDEVIIKDVQIAHIKERHPSSYERLIESVPSILADPDFIIEANKANTAVLLKELSHNKEKVKLILRFKGKDDPKEYKNSIISCWMIGDTTWRKNIKNKKILYRKE